MMNNCFILIYLSQYGEFKVWWALDMVHTIENICQTPISTTVLDGWNCLGTGLGGLAWLKSSFGKLKIRRYIITVKGGVFSPRKSKLRALHIFWFNLYSGKGLGTSIHLLWRISALLLPMSKSRECISLWSYYRQVANLIVWLLLC